MGNTRLSMWLFVLGHLSCAVAAGASSQPESRVLHVRVPMEMATESLTIDYGVYARGLHMQTVQGEKGVCEYKLPVPAQGRVKLFVYHPGFQVAQSSTPPFDKPWSPAFQRLPVTPLRGKLTDTRGNPLAHETIFMTYWMSEAMTFFGYADGAIPNIIVATTETRADGTFEVAIPLMEKDAFFQEYAARRRNGMPERKLQLSLSSPLGWFTASWELRPATIPVESEDISPIVIQRVKKAALQGRIAPAFLSKNAITGTVRSGYWPESEVGYRIELWAVPKHGGTSFNCSLQEDLTFIVHLNASEYDLELREMGRGGQLHKTVLVREGIYFSEDDEVNLVVE
jgi:hypothetical protein